jgi:hypothetical protein
MQKCEDVFLCLFKKIYLPKYELFNFNEYLYLITKYDISGSTYRSHEENVILKLKLYTNKQFFL